MKVFVTGGTGCVGQYVTKALLERGDEVTLLTRTPEKQTVLNQLKGVHLLKGSLSDLDVLSKGVQGQDAVIHMALDFSMSPFEMLEKDTRPLAWLLEQAEVSGVKKFITTSTVAVVMGRKTADVTEETYPFPVSAYAGCKAASEMITLCYSIGKDGTPVTMKRNVIRPTNCFSYPAFEGGASTGDPRYRDMMKKCFLNEDIIIRQGEGEQFISARQLAEVFLHVLDSAENEEVFYGVGKRFVTWKEIAEKAKELVPGCTSKILYDDREAAPKQGIYRQDKIREKFGLDFDGLEDLADYLKWELNAYLENLQ